MRRTALFGVFLVAWAWWSQGCAAAGPPPDCSAALIGPSSSSSSSAHDDPQLPVPSVSYALAEDCSWGSSFMLQSGAVGQPRTVQITGLQRILPGDGQVEVRRGSPPAVWCTTLPPSRSIDDAALHLVNMILVGCSLPDPAAAGKGLALRPRGLLPAAADASSQKQLYLQDVRILVSASTLQQHIQHFKKVYANAHWGALKIYTDGETFLHVPLWIDATTTWRGVGLLLADSLAAARATGVPAVRGAADAGLTAPAAAAAAAESAQPRRLLHAQQQQHHHQAPLARRLLQGGTSAGSLQQPNYVLWADNSTIIDQLVNRASVETARPLLVYIAANVTLGGAVVPAGGIHINRHLFWVGMTSANTSLDMQMTVNQFVLTQRWSNLTSDHVIFENVAAGDERSTINADPVTVGSPINMWFLFFTRRQLRHAFINSTIVIPKGAEGDLYAVIYWATIFNSGLSAFKTQAQFMRDQMQLTVDEVQVLEPGVSLLIQRFHSNHAITMDGTVTVRPVVAPPLPMPARSASISKALDATRISPLVEAVGDDNDLRDRLSMSLGPMVRGHIVLLLANVTAGAAGSPINLTCGHTVLGPSSSNDWVGPTGQRGTTVLDLGASSDALRLPAVANNPPIDAGQDPQPGSSGGAADGSSTGSCLTLQHVLIDGLAQGPGAANATSLLDPSLWTLLLWGIKRPWHAGSMASLGLDAVVMPIPAPEFDYLVRLSEATPSLVLPLTGDHAVVASGVVVQGPGRLELGTLQGAGLSGRNVTLLRQEVPEFLRSGNSSSTRQYYWFPDQAVVATDGAHQQAGRAGQAPGLQPWQVAAIAVPVAVVALAALAAVLLLAVSRRRRAQDAAKDSTDRSTAGRSKPLQPDEYADDVKGGLDANGHGPWCSDQVDETVITLMVTTDRLPPMQGSVASHGSAWQVTVHSNALTEADVRGSSTPRSRQPHDRPYSPTEEAAGARDQSRLSSKHASKRSTRISSSDKHGSSTGHRMLAAISRVMHHIHRGRRQPAGMDSGDAVMGAAGSATGDAAACRSLASFQQPSELVSDGVQLLGLLGRGTSASVYKGVWRGRLVAVKLLHVPSQEAAQHLVAAGNEGQAGRGDCRSVEEKARRMAVMEVAISSSMNHPNIVQVYGYSLEPLQDGSNNSSGSGPLARLLLPAATVTGDLSSGDEKIRSSLKQLPALGWELRLVMEYCDRGTLRDALDHDQLVTPRSSTAGGRRWPDLMVVMALALDVAAALLHLHSEELLHGDLKARNVLLAQGTLPGTAAAGAVGAGGEHGGLILRLIAKVSDFGLSTALEAEATHVSDVHGGTLSHMAPELLLAGRASKASDVYAVAVLLWELFTGARPWAGVAPAVLPMLVVKQGARPTWPQGADEALPKQLQQIIEAAWAQDPAQRPDACTLLQQLQDLEQELMWAHVGIPLQAPGYSS